MARARHRPLVAWPWLERTEYQPIAAGALDLTADVSAVVALHISDYFHDTSPSYRMNRLCDHTECGTIRSLGHFTETLSVIPLLVYVQ